MGGFHQRSCRDVFLRVIHASEDPRVAFIGEDISKYFDSLLAPHVRLVLQHLQAPPPFVDFVCSVMAEQWRVFTSGGLFGEAWHKTTKGAAQGDPLSPLVAGAVMYVWTTWVARDNTEAVSFVDDRSFWSPSSAALLAAKQRSAEVDEAFFSAVTRASASLLTSSRTTWSCLVSAYRFHVVLLPLWLVSSSTWRRLEWFARTLLRRACGREGSTTAPS